MSTYENLKYNFVVNNLTGTLPAINGANLTGIQGVNTGLIVPFAKDDVPTGFLACDGTAVSRSTYADLFGVIGTTWGSGDGSSTFNLPNLEDKTVVGKSGSKAQASTGGAENVTPTGSVSLTINNHTLSISQMPSHGHPYRQANQSTISNDAGGGAIMTDSNGSHANRSAYNGTPNNSNTQAIGGEGGGGSHNHGGSGTLSANSMSVMQPYVAVKYIIKT
jgi:microcystin-dependent protein